MKLEKLNVFNNQSKLYCQLIPMSYRLNFKSLKMFIAFLFPLATDKLI